jgi:hypothetical protein
MVSSSAVVVWKRSEIVLRAVPSLSRRLRVRGGDNEPSVGKPVGQLLMSIALGKVELLRAHLGSVVNRSRPA